MLVLGIETSCDETGLALVEDGWKVVGAQLASSLSRHQPYGGVVPEIASRAHVELLTYELDALLSSCRVSADSIDRIAVTFGPGLSGSLLMGVAAAKALSLAWRKPLVPIHHLQAHLYAALMEHPDVPKEARKVGLVISGGHTALVRMEGIERISVLGQTRDDAVGEAFDKVAQLLHLGFPGGPQIQRISEGGNARAFRFTVPRIKGGSPYDFSLSGIKTAVLYKVREAQKGGVGREESGEFVADMAASFQSAIVEEVVQKALSACREERVSDLAVGGGVVANRRLRERLQEVCAQEGIQVAIPSLGLCTDNGIMVAGLGYHRTPVPPAALTAVPDLRLEAMS